MNDGFHFLDIVFFAMVAAFLVLRLRAVLGKRTGNERRPDQWGGGTPTPAQPSGDNVVEMPRSRRPSNNAEGNEPPGIAAIRAADPSFDYEQFVAGARAAFQMIVHAFAMGDKASLKPLLAPPVFANFTAAIDARSRNGETLDTEIVSLRSAEVAEAGLEGSDAVVCLRFVSEQINVLRDTQGEVVEGDPAHPAEVVDLWTFRRDTRSGDPNWLLVATRTPEPEPTPEA